MAVEGKRPLGNEAEIQPEQKTGLLVLGPGASLRLKVNLHEDE